ncbi:FAD-dependent oxidoreductase [Actinocorallia aurea]
MTGPTRRQVLASSALAFAPVPLRAAPGKRVAVLGGGMSGLATAHELVERGFEVTVYERKALGGKARSIPVPGTGAGGRGPLPAEHGFRFFPGFYRHVTDTMRRIPLEGGGNVAGNLVGVSAGRLSRSGGRADLGVPDLSGPNGGLDLAWLRETLTGLVQQIGALPAAEIAFFVNRYLVFLTSSDERRFGQWEDVPWWEFVRAEGKSADYRAIVAKFLTRGLVAVKEEVASTRTVGNMGQAFFLSAVGLGRDGEDAAIARMLNGPTNEAWIDPWVGFLKERGVRFVLDRTAEGFDLAGGRITSARAVDGTGGRHRIDADWFVCAVPPDRAVRLWSPELLRLAPSLEGVGRLRTDWMNGVQFYLRESPRGLGELLSFMDSQWQITAVLQSSLWDRDFKADYGDGSVADCLSLDVSDWDTPGIVYGKPAKRCSPAQIIAECWAQMKAHLEDTGASVLPDAILHSWFIDPAISWDAATGQNANDELLTVNTIGSWRDRPEARVGVPNLFLAGDYLRTHTDLATMESANESARRAVAALLEEAGSAASAPTLWPLYQPPQLDGLKRLDARRFSRGLPHVLDL